MTTISDREPAAVADGSATGSEPRKPWSAPTLKVVSIVDVTAGNETDTTFDGIFFGNFS